METTTLGDLLGTLHRGRVTGMLELTEPHGARHRVHLSHGLVCGVETQRAAPKLGAVLRSMGVLSSRARTEIERCTMGELTAPLGEALVERCLLSRAALKAALERQLRTRLEMLYGIKHARVVFRVRGDKEVRQAVLAPSDFLHGRPRKRRRSNVPEFRTRQLEPPRSREEALAILGLSPGADSRSVRAAFRKLAVEYHPDRRPLGSAAEHAAMVRQFACVSAAYHLLVA